MRHTGTLVRWLGHKGFGFIEQPDGVTTFVHVHAFLPGTDPAVGDKVSFDIEISPRDGRDRAANARIVEAAS